MKTNTFDSVGTPVPATAVLLLDAKGRVVQLRPSSVPVLGFAEGSLINRFLWEFIEIGFAWSELTETVDKHFYWNRESEVRGGSETFPVVLSLSPFSGEGTASYLAVVHDLREQKNSEEKMRTTNLLFEQVAQNMSEVLWVLDQRRKYPIYISPAFESVWGFSLNAFYRDSSLLLETIHPEDRAKMTQLRERSPWEIDEEYRIIRSDSTIRWIRERTFPIPDEHGEVYRILGISSDITRFKDAAQKEKQQREQLIQADKMSSLGVLVAGVAHEINNPNNFIQLNLDLLGKVWLDALKVLDDHAKIKDNFKLAGIPYDEMRGEVDDLLEGMSEGSRRIAEIVKNLKNYARMESKHEMEAVEINKVVEASIRIIDNKIKKTTDHFEVNIDDDIPAVRANFQRLEQVLINLLINSCESMTSRDGRLGIRSYYDGDSDRVIVRVSDEGCGMTEEQMQHLFEPFYTTRQQKGGTGLGLSVTYSIVKEHGGELRFSSTKGRGTIATLSLPSMSKL